MNKQSLMTRIALVLAAVGVIAAGAATQAQAAGEHTATSSITVSAQGELFPELNGRRIKAANSSDVYLVLDGQRHLIPSSVTYNALFAGTDGIRLVLTTDNISDGGVLTAYAYLARSTTDVTVYLISNGYKREITPTAMDAYGFDWQKVRTTYPEALAALPTAAPLNWPPGRRVLRCEHSGAVRPLSHTKAPEQPARKPRCQKRSSGNSTGPSRSSPELTAASAAPSRRLLEPGAVNV